MVFGMSMLQFRTFPRISHVVWVICIAVAARGSFYLLTDGFSIRKIENTFPMASEWQLAPPSRSQRAELKKICTRPFYYLGKGSQVYAFVSEDEQYVLKLFKCYHLSRANWLSRLPLPGSLSHWQNEALQKRHKKISATLNSYKIAGTQLQDECALVAMEILPTPGVNQEVTIFDKLGRKFTINLGNYGFIVQRRADLIYPKFARWIAQGELTEAKNAIRSIISLIVRRSKRGVQDSDPDLHKNSGLIGTDAIFIDMGSFHLNEEASAKEVYLQDLEKITKRFSEWLQKQSPELAEYLQEEIKKRRSWHSLSTLDSNAR